MTTSQTENSRGHWLDAWHVAPAANREYEFIDGLRGIAILMVLCAHHLYVNPKSGPGVQFVGALAATGGRGVQIFFALSGFLISWPFWKRKFSGASSVIPPQYGWRRFWKIYPPLALSVILLTPGYLLLTGDSSYIYIAAKWLTGIPFLLPVSGKFNPVMWTLVIEVQFYMILPLAFLVLKRVPARMSLWLIPLLFLGPPIVYREMTGNYATLSPNIDSYFPSTLDVFCLGILVAGLDVQRSLKESWAHLGTVGLIVWAFLPPLLAWMNTHASWNSDSLLLAERWLEKIASACLLLFVANPRNPIAKALSSAWLRWCGIISYEWYLFHQPIILWARQLFGPGNGSVVRYVGLVGGAFLLSAVLAAVIYRYFSLPILRWRRPVREVDSRKRTEAAKIEDGQHENFQPGKGEIGR